MYEVLLFSLFLAVLAALIIYSIETVKPVTSLSWSLLVDNVKNVRLSWQLPSNVDKLGLRLKLNGTLVTADLPVDASSWDFPVDAGTKVDAEVIVTFEGKEAKAVVSFEVPKGGSAGVEPVTGLSWEILEEADESNETLFDDGVDLDKDGNVDYYLATKKPAVDVKIPPVDFKSLDANIQKMVDEKVAAALAKVRRSSS